MTRHETGQPTNLTPETTAFHSEIWQQKLLHTGHAPKHLCNDFRASFHKKDNHFRMTPARKGDRPRLLPRLSHTAVLQKSIPTQIRQLILYFG